MMNFGSREKMLSVYHLFLGIGFVIVLVFKGIVLPLLLGNGQGVTLLDFIIYIPLWSVPHIFVAISLYKRSSSALFFSLIVQAFFLHLFTYQGFDQQTLYHWVLFIPYLITTFTLISTYSVSVQNPHSWVFQRKNRIILCLCMFFIVSFFNRLGKELFTFQRINVLFQSAYGVLTQTFLWTAGYTAIQKSNKGRTLLQTMNENLPVGVILTSVASVFMIVLSSF